MKYIRRAFAAFICAFAMNSAQAGIPVIDVGSILNLVLQYEQLMQQYETLKGSLQTANDQLQSMKGARGMGSLLSDPAIQSQLPPDWSATLSQIRSSGAYASERAKFPTSANPKMNAVYDSIATNNATMSDFFANANKRVAQVASLQASIDSADDPAAKADLQNRFVHEQNAIASSTQLLAVLQKKQEEEMREARQSAHQNLVCKEFKNAGCP